MKKFFKKLFSDWYRSNTCSMRGVVPEARYDYRKNVFYLSSEAGQVIYKPRDLNKLTRFRDVYVNEFNKIGSISDLRLRRDRLFALYRKVRAEKGVKYRANLRTRFEGAFSWNLAK